MDEIEIWHQATLVTMASTQDYGIIEKGALVVQAGQIKWVGAEKDLPPWWQKAGKFYSAQGGCITPGLIDCHTHLVYAGERSGEFTQRLAGKSYQAITAQGGGIYATVRATRQINAQQLYQESAQRLKNWLQEGVTTIEIKSGYGLDEVTERKILTVARQLSEHFPIDVQTTFLGAHVLAPEFSDKKSYIAALKPILQRLCAEKLIDAVDGFCDPIAFSAEELSELFLMAQQLQLPIKVHVDQLSLTQGAQLAYQFQALSADHLEYLDEQGAQLLKKSNTVAVLLPGAYYFLQQAQKPPLELLRHYKIPMAIATDCNPGTAPTTSLLLMLNMSCLLFGLTPLEALQGVTVHAAQALGMSTTKGKLAPHFAADFVVWRIQHPNELAYYFGDNRCQQVIKRGKIVYERT